MINKILLFCSHPLPFIKRYQLAESIDGQLKRMVLDLKEIIDHLNTTNSTEENTDPVSKNSFVASRES